MQRDCPFCNLDPKETVVFENDHCMYLSGMELVLKGSGVIVPKAHRPTVFDLTPDEWAATYDLLGKVQDKLSRELKPDGFNVGWNCGAVGGQSIHHAHLHVIPRFADEPFAGKGIRHWLKSTDNLRLSNFKERFWSHLDQLLATHEIAIDRPRATAHPRYPDLIMPLDYGYLLGTQSMDGGGIDLWRGSLHEGGVCGVIVTVDLGKNDSEIKLLVDCTREEATTALSFHNTGPQAGDLVWRESRGS